MGTLTNSKSSKNVFMFGAGKPDPAFGHTSANIGSLVVRLDGLSQDVQDGKITSLLFRTNYTVLVQKEEEQANSSSNNEAET